MRAHEASRALSSLCLNARHGPLGERRLHRVALVKLARWCTATCARSEMRSEGPPAAAPLRAGFGEVLGDRLAATIVMGLQTALVLRCVDASDAAVAASSRGTKLI